MTTLGKAPLVATGLELELDGQLVAPSTGSRAPTAPVFLPATAGPWPILLRIAVERAVRQRLAAYGMRALVLNHPRLTPFGLSTSRREIQVGPDCRCRASADP